MAISIVESMLAEETQHITTLTKEQISKTCKEVIRVMRNELPEEAHSMEVFDYMLAEIKEVLHSTPIRL